MKFNFDAKNSYDSSEISFELSHVTDEISKFHLKGNNITVFCFDIDKQILRDLRECINSFLCDGNLKEFKFPILTQTILEFKAEEDTEPNIIVYKEYSDIDVLCTRIIPVDKQKLGDLRDFISRFLIADSKW